MKTLEWNKRYTPLSLRNNRLGLFYSNEQNFQLVGFAYASYLSDPHKARSQIVYVFTYRETIISWHFTKQTIAVTSSNYAEILTLQEAKENMYDSNQ